MIHSIYFNMLSPVFIIFIAPFDLLGEDNYRYTFSMRCDEKPSIALHDGAVRIFLNTNGCDDENITPELKELLYFMEHTNDNEIQYNSERVRDLRESVRTIQTNEEVGVRFMQAWEERILDRREAEEIGRQKGREKGLKEGREEGKKSNMIKNINALMKTMNLTAEQAMDAMMIPDDDRKAIAALL